MTVLRRERIEKGPQAGGHKVKGTQNQVPFLRSVGGKYWHYEWRKNIFKGLYKTIPETGFSKCDVWEALFYFSGRDALHCRVILDCSGWFQVRAEDENPHVYELLAHFEDTHRVEINL